MSSNGSGVVLANATLAGVENMFRQTIIEKLGEDKDALKALEVKFWRPPTFQERKVYKRLGKRLFEVTGYLALDDSGDGKVFQFTMEEGLSDADDREIADQAAHQCLKCVAAMRREKGLSNQHIVKKVRRRGTH